MTKIAMLNVATALAGALTLAAAAPAQAQGGLEKCYGIALAGQNSCANAKGTHSCAGQSKVNWDGGEWRAVATGMCVGLNGSLTPFEGVNPKMPRA